MSQHGKKPPDTAGKSKLCKLATDCKWVYKIHFAHEHLFTQNKEILKTKSNKKCMTGEKRKCKIEKLKDMWEYLNKWRHIPSSWMDIRFVKYYPCKTAVSHMQAKSIGCGRELHSFPLTSSWKKEEWRRISFKNLKRSWQEGVVVGVNCQPDRLQTCLRDSFWACLWEIIFTAFICCGKTLPL